MTSITTSLTTSGNSKAIRLPKELLRMSRLGEVVELEAKRGQIIIRSSKNPRASWRLKIAKELKANGPLKNTDKFGDMNTENEATLSDGLAE